MLMSKCAYAAALMVTMALATGNGMLADAAESRPSNSNRSRAKSEPDYSHPKKTMRLFCAAIRDGDVEALKDCGLRVNAKTRRLRDATVHYAVAQHRFHKAASDKFGADRLWNDNVSVWLKGTKNAEVHVEGDRAALTIKEDGTTIQFQKEGNAWKVNLIEFDEEEIENAKPAVVAGAARDLETDAKSYEDLARRIETGKLKTADDVKRVMGEKLPPRGVSLEP